MVQEPDITVHVKFTGPNYEFLNMLCRTLKLDPSDLINTLFGVPTQTIPNVMKAPTAEAAEAAIHNNISDIFLSLIHISEPTRPY